MIRRICIVLALTAMMLIPVSTLVTVIEGSVIETVAEQTYTGVISNRYPFRATIKITDHKTGSVLFSDTIPPKSQQYIQLPLSDYYIDTALFDDDGKLLAKDRYLFVMQLESVPDPYYPFKIELGRRGGGNRVG